MAFTRTLIISTVICCSNLNAEEQPYDGDLFALSLDDLLEISVETVSMFKDDLNKVAASVYSVDLEDANRWDYWDNSDALDMAAGVQSYHTFFGGNPVAIRGYSQLLSVRGVATLIDGVPVNDITFGSAQYDNEHISLGIIDRLELIKGPGSTLYGTDAFHGTMAFKSYYREEKDFSTDVFISSRQMYRTNMAWSGEIEKEHFINLALDNRVQQSLEWPYFNNVIQQAANRQQELDNRSYTLKFHNKKESNWYYNLSLVGNGYEGEGFVGGGESFGYQQNDLSLADHKMKLHKGLLSYQFSNSYRIGFTGSQTDLERVNWFQIQTGIFEQNQKFDKRQAQLFLSAEYQSGNRYFAAIERSSIEIKQSQSSVLNQDLMPLFSFTEPEKGYRRTVNSAFIQGRWISGWNNLEMELGIRYDNYSDFGHQFTPRLGFILPLDNGDVAKLLYGNAFRAPVTLEILGSTAIKGNKDISPEVLDSLEAVYLRLEDTWQLEFIAYYNQWTDGIISQPIVDAVYSNAYVNIGENKAYGLEVSYRYSGESLSFEWNSGYAISKNELTGSEFSAFPKLSSNAQASYKLTDKMVVATKLIYRDKWTAVTDENSTALRSYLRVDANISYQLNESISVRLIAKNIFNRKNRIPSLLNVPAGEQDLLERQISLGVSFKF